LGLHRVIIQYMKNINDIQIEFPCVGQTYARNEYGVYEYGVYPRSSVLAGQTRRVFLDSFESLTAARAAYPGASEIILEPLTSEGWD
jgi:hypothetical protein